MENVTLDSATIELETQFAQYKDLSTRRDALQERISRAEAQRPSLKDKIFLRVLRGYQNDLQTLEKDLAPLQKKIDGARSDLKRKIEDIDIQTAELQDKLDEFAFRHRVGEFDDAELAERQCPVEAEYEELTQRGIGLVQLLEKLEAAPDASSTAEHKRHAPPNPDVEATVDPPSVKTAEPERDSRAKGNPESPAADQPEQAALDETSANADDKLTLDADNEGEPLVDPSKWVGEFAEEGFVRSPGSESADGDAETPDKEPPKEISDVLGYTEVNMDEGANSPNPLSELADPSDDADGPAGPQPHPDTQSPVEAPQPDNKTANTELGQAFPVLSIIKGAGAGKKLPLLPMTMTIGREVDNNIEIKDQDVARYHARITYHAGEYIAHDLEGSSGTYVNGEKTSKKTLSPGDTIRVGDTELKFDVE
jgi:hypothetical protein